MTRAAVAAPATPLAGGLALTASAAGFRGHGARERIGAGPAGLQPWVPGVTAAMRDLADQAASAAARDGASVLVLGERGTGKGRLAALIHARGARAGRPFIEVNCAALATSAAEGGAAAGATALFALAADGTLFLDEVSELPMALQATLLEAIGGRWGAVRVVAATRHDLVGGVTEGTFREDLYYRLATTPLHLPPLRARARADLVAVVADVADDLAAELPEAPRAISPAALEALVRQPWPGNVRELRNALERALLAARGAAVLRPEHLPAELRDQPRPDGAHEPRTLADVEKEQIGRSLRAHDGNRTHAARELGISRATLIKKVREYGLGAAPRSRRAGETDHPMDHPDE